jgi:hypothetical protein
LEVSPWMHIISPSRSHYNLANHYGMSQLTMDIFRCQNHVFFFVPVPSQECTVT